MHITDGVLSIPVLAAGYAVAGGMCALGARKIRDEEIPRVALLTAAFFVVSTIRVQAGVTSVHLVLNGLIGVLLGTRAFLVFPIGLTLQALLLFHGGFTTIGVNACIFGIPAWMSYGIFWLLRSKFGGPPFLAGSIAGASGVILAGLAMAGFLVTAGENFKAVAIGVVGIHGLVAILEGIMTGFCVRYLHAGRPDLLQTSNGRSQAPP